MAMSPSEELGDAVRPIPAVRTPSVYRDHIAPTSIHSDSLLSMARFKRIDFLPIDDINRRDTIKPVWSVHQQYVDGLVDSLHYPELELDRTEDRSTFFQ